MRRRDGSDVLLDLAAHYPQTRLATLEVNRWTRDGQILRRIRRDEDDGLVFDVDLGSRENLDL
jgi:hypothetical protein